MPDENRARINSLEERVDVLQERIDILEERVSSMSSVWKRTERRISKIEREWSQARGGMSVIWEKIRDAVSLSYDRLKVVERTVGQLAKIVNLLSREKSILEIRDTGKLSAVQRRSWLVVLARLMNASFSEEEIINLAFQTSIDHEQLPGKTKTQLIREMLLHFYRLNEMDIILSVVAKERPNVVWPKSPMEVVLDFDPQSAWEADFD